MNFHEDYRNLRFARRIPVVPQPLVALGIAAIVFTLVWLIVPPSALYWLLLPIVLVLVWLSGYGWRDGLSDFIKLLKRLETL